MATTLNRLNELIGACGCCELPTCCPPLIECRTLQSSFSFATGFTQDADPKQYRVEELGTSYGLHDPVTDTFPGTDETYISEEYTGSGSVTTRTEISSLWQAGFIGASPCGTPSSEDITSETTCTAAGGGSHKFFGGYFEDDSWHTYLASEVTYAGTDVSNEQTPEHAAWEEDHDVWLGELAAYEAEYAEYEEDHAEWVEGGMVGPEPEPPEPIREEPVEPPYGHPCGTLSVVATTTVYDGPDDSEGETTSSEFFTLVGSLPLWDGTTEDTRTLTEGNTPEELVGLAQAWADGNVAAAFEACPGGEGCLAIGPDETTGETQYFRYRYKLNRCCGWKTIRSEWLEIEADQPWLDWEAAGDEEAEEPPGAIDTPRVWEWSGTPTSEGCRDEDGNPDPEADPYIDEDMWSEWSSPLGAGLDTGRLVVLRDYRQKCYQAPPQTFPDLL